MALLRMFLSDYPPSLLLSGMCLNKDVLDNKEECHC